MFLGIFCGVFGDFLWGFLRVLGAFLVFLESF